MLENLLPLPNRAAAASGCARVRRRSALPEDQATMVDRHGSAVLDRVDAMPRRPLTGS